MMLRPTTAVLLMVACAPARAGSGPVLTHVTDPTPPGKLCVVVGDGWDKARPALRCWRVPDGDPGQPDAAGAPRVAPGPTAPQVLAVLKQEPHVLVCRVPAGRFGVLGVQSARGKAWGPVRVINRARADWLSTDRAEPGRTVRVIGRNLVDLALYADRDAQDRPVSYAGYVKSATRVVLRAASGGAVTGAPVTKASAYDVHFQLPKALEPGRYHVYVHNGLGGRWGWSLPLDLTVLPVKPWPTRTFNVRDYGTVGDGKADDAPAIQRALDAAGKGGGGVVYLPPGSYLINRTLVVPRRTVVRGASRDRTWIWLPNGVHYGTRADGMALQVGLTGDGDFVLEDLTMHGVYVKHLVQAPVGFADRDAPPAENVTIRRCRLMVEPTLRHPYRRGDPFLLAERLDRDSRWCYRFAVCLRGDYCRVEDCRIRGGGTCIHLKGSRYVTIARNDMLQGTGHSFIIFPSPTMPEKIIIEDNTTRPVSNVHSATLWSHVKAKRYYVARNRFELDWCRDNECMCWHSTGYRLATHVVRAAGTSLTFSTADTLAWTKRPRIRAGFLDRETGKARDGALAGFECLVIQGRGLGQMRGVVGNTGDTITLDRPWDLPPGPGSLVALTQNPQFEGLIVVDNVLDHTGSGIAPWGNAYDIIVDGNRLSRSGGVDLCDVGSPGTYREWGGNYFAQLIHNTVSVGRYHAHWPVRAAAHIFQGLLGWDPQGASIGVAGLEVVLRGNRTETDSFIALVSRRGVPILGTAIEDNRCVDCHVGVWLGKGTSGVLGANRFERVDEPIRDEGSSMWVHPGRRLSARLAGTHNVATASGIALGDDWQAVRREAGALAKRDGADRALRAACDGLFVRAWKAVAGGKAGAHAQRLLQSLLGLHVVPDKRQPIDKTLSNGKGGKSHLALVVRLAPGAPPLQLAVRAHWPKGWQTSGGDVSMRLGPGEREMPLPVVLPTGAWGPYWVPLTLRVTLAGASLDAPMDLNVGRGAINQWMVVGPFRNTHKTGIDLSVHPPEERIDLRGEYAGDRGKVRWQPHTASPWASFRKAMKRTRDATGLALACIRAKRDVRATLTFRVHGSAQVWLNDEEVASIAGPRATRPVGVGLKAGDNILLVKVSAQANDWAVSVELSSTDPHASGQVTQVPVTELVRMRALCPPPIPKSKQISLKYAGGVPWRLVYEDTFDRRVLGPELRAATGTWKIVGGVLRGSDRAFLAYRRKLPAPVRIEYDARSASPSDLSAFWLTDPADFGSGYLFAFASGNTSNRVTVDNNTVARSERPLAKPGKWHHVIAQLLPRSRFQIIVDGQIAVRGRTGRPPAKGRYPGLWAWGTGEFDNLRIYVGAGH